MQDAMRGLIIGLCTATHDPEHRGHRPLAWGKDSASEEDFDVLPHRSSKDRGKDANGTAKGDRQGEHGRPFR
jgi:hypothetical protein